MKNAAKLIEKMRMPAGPDGDAPARSKAPASDDPDFDPAFEAGADSEPAVGGLADFSEEELRAELAKRKSAAKPAADEEMADEEADPEEDEEADPPTNALGSY